jgi:polyhydroxyalkanoate synthesis regulator phasin
MSGGIQVRRKDDQIFQLSLTEIAFTLAFLLMLLLGYMLAQADRHAKGLELSLAKSGELDTNRKALEQARQNLAKALSEAGAKPDEVISSLIAQAKLAQERDTLRKQVDDLDKQLSALTEVKKMLDAAKGGAGSSDVVRKEVTDALALKAKLEERLGAQEAVMVPSSIKATSTPASSVAAGTADTRSPTAKEPAAPTERPGRRDVATEALAGLSLKEQLTKQLHDQLGEPYVAGHEETLAQELVAARKELKAVASTSGGVAGVAKENADLRGQVAFLKARLDARGGRDYPPCWADEQTGKVEFLFTIEISPDGLRVTPAWPEKRQADATSIPGVARFSEPTSLSLSEFSSAMQRIDRVSKEKNCRHYVYVKNRVTDLGSFNRSRYAIENFFYKLELRS